VEGGRGLGPDRPWTYAPFTRTPTESGTRLSLVQSGFKPDQKRNLAGAKLRLEDDGKLVDLLAGIP